VLVSLSRAMGARAQLPADIQPGTLIERVASVADSTRSYALYLPASYRPGVRHPFVVVMDPRGRALLAMRLVRPAAERLGWIAMSSYDTRSDEATDPNGPAVAAMLTDAQRQLSIHPRRVYLVGFSGTARLAWHYAFRLRGYVAGLIGFGAGFPIPFDLPAPLSQPLPAYFGGAGTTDNNYGEVRELETRLAGSGLAYRFEYHDGPHAWPPEPIVAQGLTWMELQAMRSGLRERDDSWIDSLHQSELDSATRLEAGGHLYAAWQRYGAIARDFAGLRDVSAVEARVAALQDSAPVAAVRRFLEADAHRDRDYAELMADFFRQARTSPVAQPLDLALARLQIRELQLQAAQQEDTLAALAARRRLDGVFVTAAFYEPREYLAHGEADRALALLALAGEITPAAPIVCYHRARALLQQGRMDQAVAELTCWADALDGALARLEQDTTLSLLRGHPAYEALLARLRAGRPDPTPESPTR
jgi:predicted esterase